MKDLILKKCLKCGTLVKVIEDCPCKNCDINCCETKMEVLKPNTVEASIEKHIPNIEKKDKEIIITVNHVMENDHYINFILYKSEDIEIIKYYKSGEKPELKVSDHGKAKVYAYCNKHGLWEREID